MSVQTLPRRSLKEIVIDALHYQPELRETRNSDRLTAYVQKSLKNENRPSAKGNSIDRIARIVRNERPELRGEDYERNHDRRRREIARQIITESFGYDSSSEACDE